LASLSANARGIILMVAASGAFVINDSLFKMASTELPVFQALFLRGVAAAIWCLPMVFITRSAHRMGMIFDRWALLRNVFEIIAVFCFLNALARIPIADITAIGQLSPMLLLIGAAVIFRERLGVTRIALILVGFAGAMLIAQPQSGSISPFMVLGLIAAVAMAGRDMVARMVPTAVPGPVVAYGAVIMVMLASLVATVLFDDWVAPSIEVLGILAASGVFLMFGQLFIFLTFRAAPVSVVAPFLYSATLWALLLGLVMFGDFPNALAIAGIGLILVSGVLLVVRSGRQAVVTRTAIDLKQGSGGA
jgi:drug/metabolite transporter (DMT)-like permease